jgi:hypothetical protein
MTTQLAGTSPNGAVAYTKQSRCLRHPAVIHIHMSLNWTELHGYRPTVVAICVSCDHLIVN